ncbi:magnesium/cobalt transporter CorA [Bacillus carboniphilus]|uniref:Magnesium transport protein CorA n=1 Tax=Bacillus carboniphilus TaxID=86663 RepID=A0ABN0VUV7_9BACI
MIQVIIRTEQNEVISSHSLKDLQRPDIVWYWVDFNQPSEEESMELKNTFHFHPLAIEDCTSIRQRPKLDYYSDYHFFVTHRLNPETYEREEINLFVSDDFIVTYHQNVSPEVNDVTRRLLHTENAEEGNSFYVLHQLLDKIVDDYFPIVYKLEDEISDIEDQVEGTGMEGLLERLFDIRHYLLTLRHTVHPMRDLLYRIINSTKIFKVQERKEYFSDIHDHLLKLAEMIESNREITNDIRDSYMSLNSHQTNHVMKVLTLVTTIFMPLTFIAGVYGMNFVYMPELDERYGYFIILSIMLIISFGMFGWFKRKGWFK